ncbi:hypothetical protein DBR37_11185 [Herminiimonas sp. KBW02]|uniref:PP0621 family protein n=1 Tax=Herminiimonas sp. KBW02 TaxID=2153363 RepID=UPI000F5B729C|nr:PP0621 family protein [Herminiimonas sp. KBW02]RQO34927.1 hypothetical protein DBR37_11185 [Herminiimonas sp. KBW02]
MKLLLWAGVIVAVIWILRSKKSSKAAPPKTPPPAPTQAPSAAGEAEKMLSCAYCGTHFPASEAVSGSSNLVFCSDEHRRQYLAR